MYTTMNNPLYYSTLSTGVPISGSSHIANPSSQPILAHTPYTLFPYQHALANFIHPNHIPSLFIHPPASQGFNHNPHINFNPIPKIEFSKFDVSDPKCWLIKAEQYLEFINIDEMKKVSWLVTFWRESEHLV